MCVYDTKWVCVGDEEQNMHLTLQANLTFLETALQTLGENEQSCQSCANLGSVGCLSLEPVSLTVHISLRF